MSVKGTNTESRTNLFDLEPKEEKVMIGAVISLLAFFILGGLVASLIVTGIIARFLQIKANLTIGQGLLYIAVPLITVGIITAFGLRHHHAEENSIKIT